jgi:hypothetical protein
VHGEPSASAEPLDATADASVVVVEQRDEQEETLRRLRRIEAASRGAVRRSFSRRRRWKSYARILAKMTRPVIA